MLLTPSIALNLRPIALGLGLASFGVADATEAIGDGSSSRPNIVLILADDLGYGDLGCYSAASGISTPNLDRLAEGGLRFTDAHSPSAVCTPTRYAVLTGRYSWRTRLKSEVLDGFSPPLIEVSRPTIASFLQGLGYRTACFGKWHLGMQWTRLDGTPEDVDRAPPPAGFRSGESIDFSRPLKGGPGDVGFGYFWGISASLDMPPYCWVENDRCVGVPRRMAPGMADLLLSMPRGLVADGFELDGVLPELKRRTVAWIAEHARNVPGQPFFLYLPLNSPHLPVVPSAGFVGRSQVGPYGDFVMETDDYVGAVMQVLDRSGLSENTLVIFTSDNGGLFHYWEPQEADDRAGYESSRWANHIREYGHRSNGTLRGSKADIYEGGHRVPLIVHWPSRVTPGVTAVPVELTDLFGTVADIVHAPLPAAAAPDSFSFSPLFDRRGRQTATRPFLVHHSFLGVFAVRQGEWKFIEQRGSGGFSTPRSVRPAPGEATGQLYNLKDDQSETRNLYAAEPQRVREFKSLLLRIKSGEALRPSSALNVNAQR